MMNEILIKGALEMGLQITETVAGTFQRYYELLEEKNRVMNLTAITDEDEAAAMHFLDSIALLNMTDFRHKSVIDIGSGAGFPGLPLKLMEPSLSLTLLDAQQKRIGFLNEVCAKLEMKDVICQHARAEEAAYRPEQRGIYDIALSRAVARLNILCELCLPFVRPGGQFIAMKGADSDSEIAEAAEAAETLGAKIDQCVDYKLPFKGITHRAVLIGKYEATPDTYPRRYARIQKKPL